MPIAIQRITAKDLGPLRSVNFELGQFNVFFGRNEMGKTSLVEFLLRSLFSSSKKWNLRTFNGPGQVVLTGLEKAPTTFSPDSDKKLEDYWIEQERGYPPDLARLLVVKGAELELARDAEGGIDRAILRRYLSQTAILDAIRDAIPATIQKASIAAGLIEGNNQGKLKVQREQKRAREDIDRLLTEVSENYSSGRLAGYLRHEGEIQASIALQMGAKRHLAYQLHMQRGQILKDLSALPPEDLRALDDRLRDFGRLLQDMHDVEENAARTEHAAEDHRWLSRALESLDEKAAEGKRPPAALLILTGAVLAAGAALSWMNQPCFAAGAVLAGMALGGWYAYCWRRWDQARPDVLVREEIKAEFERRFQLTQTDYASMLARKEVLQADAIRHTDSLEKLAALRGERRTLQAEIGAISRRLNQTELPPAKWEERFQALRANRIDLDQRQNELLLRQTALQIEEKDFLSEAGEEDFDPEQLKTLEQELSQLRTNIQDEKTRFGELRARIQQLTESTADESWEDLLNRLQHARSETADAYRQSTAEILGQILVSRVADEMFAEEDDIIRAQLQTGEVREPLYAITHRYRNVALKQDQLYLSDDYQTFPLRDLSTGAQEQVLLALRMAFAAQLMQKERLFLILDDAFQYADWRRREYLVDRVVRLGEQGWQILYLTMDDHLRGLFKSRGEKAFGPGFAEFDLTQN
ncbi:MAG: hypothetical protein JXA97_11640 [Anaerolineales bacterium]|nr:hypothetical protein [Anaerolineales bacterium]